MSTEPREPASPLELIESLFHAALALPPDRIDAFLDERCAGDQSLQRQLNALLASHRQAGQFIETPLVQPKEGVFDEPGADRLIDQIIGHYRILQRLGEGGMGVVYLAQRADQHYEKRVAIKLIKRGMDTDSVLRHFHTERQILATFDHPNIARLLDGGATADGLPYFVMEHVEGVPIDAYCHAHELSITQRLQLFREVCGAVSYAHRHAVIHRDLKPSNILVGSNGVPKLLDFGIAKVLQPGEQRESILTMIGLRLMTPDYASPEQVRGEPLTTASDVYSLGVVLYRLLTGSQPYELPRASADISRAITATEPRKPSAAVTLIGSAAASAAEPAPWSADGSAERWARGLRGDLDNIVLMALRKEPARRYQSVEQFSEDIRRHLETLPVLARKDTLGYRGGKFVQRNRVATVAAAIVAVSLLGGIIATTWQAQKAREQEAIAKAEKTRAVRRFNDVRRLAHSVLFDYYDAIKDLSGATAARERLVKDALTYLDSLAGEATGDVALQRELAAAYDRVGDVRGAVYSTASLGDATGAMDSYSKALAIREAMVAADPHDNQSRRDLAGSYTKIGSQLLETSEANRGVDYLKKAIGVYVQLMKDNPEMAELPQDLARAYNNLGLALEDRGDAAGAVRSQREALRLREEILATDPDNHTYQRGLAVSRINLGRALVLSGDTARGLQNNQKALVICTGLVASNPRDASYRRLLANTYQNDGDYRNFLHDTGAALQSFRKKLVLDEQSLAEDPVNAQAQGDVAYSVERIGDLLAAAGNDLEAMAYRTRAVALYEKLAAEAPDDLYVHDRALLVRSGIASTLVRLGRSDAARAASARVIEAIAKTPEDPGNSYHSGMRAKAYMHLGETYAALAANAQASANARREDRRAARTMYEQSSALWQAMAKHGTLTAEDSAQPEEVARELAKLNSLPQ